MNDEMAVVGDLPPRVSAKKAGMLKVLEFARAAGGAWCRVATRKSLGSASGLVSGWKRLNAPLCCGFEFACRRTEDWKGEVYCRWNGGVG